MDATTLITGSSNSSGYGGSATTTPTTPLGSYDTRSLSTPTPTTVATVATITPTAVSNGMQQHHYNNNNIPVATVAAVTPFYSEALNNIELQQKQQQTAKHTQRQRQHQQQQQQQQPAYFQAPHTTNYSTLYDSTLNSNRAMHSMEQFNAYDERSTVATTSHLRRHSVCLAPSTGAANIEAYGYAPPTAATTFNNTNQNKIATSVVTTKPQAMATPFYASATNNLMSSGAYYESPAYKYKIPELPEYAYNTQPYQQHPATYFPPSKTQTAANYGVPLKSVPARPASNLFEKYEKYLPNNNAVARGSYNTPFDADIYARHKPTHVPNNNANFLWNVPDYTDFLATTNAPATTNKYEKFNSHAAYFPPPTVNNMPQTMWPNTPPHYMERLPPPPPPPPPTHALSPAYHHQQLSSAYATSPYMQQAARNNYNAPYQQQPQPYYASRRAPVPTKYADYGTPPHHTLAHHALNKPKMSNDLHFGAATYEMPGAYNYATNVTPPNQATEQAKNCFYTNYETYNGMPVAGHSQQQQQQQQQQHEQQQQQMYVGETTTTATPYMLQQQRLNYNTNYYVTPQNAASTYTQQQQHQQQQQQQNMQTLQQQPENLMQIDYTQNNNCYLSPSITTNLNENCSIITNVANYADQYGISGTRSAITTYCNNNNHDNNNNQKDNNNLIDNQTQVAATLGKNLSIRDFLTSWNDEEEDFAASVEDFSFMETSEIDKNKSVIVQSVTMLNTPAMTQLENYEHEILYTTTTTENVHSNDLVLAVNAEANQYTNLPDIVIDTEKSSTVMPSSTLAEVKSNFADFDVEMELDQLQSKQPNVPATAEQPSDAFSKCLERADFNANIEANLRKVAEKLTAHIEQRLQKSTTTSEDQQETTGNRTAFEKEYKTFIHKIDTKTQYKTANNTVEQAESTNLSKRKRKLSNSESTAAKKALLWRKSIRKRVQLSRYFKIVQSLSVQQAYKNLLAKNEKQKFIETLIKRRNLIRKCEETNDKLVEEKTALKTKEFLNLDENSNSSISSNSSSSSLSSTTTSTTSSSSSSSASKASSIKQENVSQKSSVGSLHDYADVCDTNLKTIWREECETLADKAPIVDKSLMQNVQDKTMITEVASPKSIISNSTDVSEECYGFGSGEESEAFQSQHNKRKDAMEICQRLLESPVDGEDIPKLGALCQQALHEKKCTKEQEILSVEDALAEMYRNAGVLSDMEDNAEEAQTDEVLIINLQEILDGDSDVYLLQCDINENILAANTNVQTENIDLVQILNADVDDDRNDNNMALGSGGLNSPEYVLTPIPSIHHEEIVPDNYIKYKKESFLKYLHAKYVQNHLSKFHCAHRILKKYKRRLPRKLFKNC